MSNDCIWYPGGRHFPSYGFSDYPVLLEYQCCNCCMKVLCLNQQGIPADWYKIISGEWPKDLTINIGSDGCISGVITENRITSPVKMGNPPRPVPWDMGNYPEYTRPGLNAVFTVLSSHGCQATFSAFFTTDWSSQRDDFLLNIKNEYPLEKNPDLDIEYPKGKGFTFFLDGSPSSNEDYLVNMKSRGYFPGPGECSPFYKYTQMKPKPFKPLF